MKVIYDYVGNVVVDDVVAKYDVKVMGPFMVGVHKKMSHPKITLKTLLW
jgi:hypothetical protein